MIENCSIPIRFYEKTKGNNRISFLKCKIYKNGPRYNTALRGCCGLLKIIKLSNGSIIKTNDLWYEMDDLLNEKIFKTISKHDLLGEVIHDYKKIDNYSNIREEYIYPITPLSL